ncbi:MAG: serine/threonine protein kinase, partial [Rhizobacter sp.]|nr:serine/threonine protein kinase [Bacteriovorax sp.]
TKRERFGRYLILDHLVDGGMAKICRARYLGEQGEKVVAIKMVQPQFSKDEAFKTMFMDEIRVTFGLLHPNVIQTYDYGMNKGQLYVAMEYCDGRNLKEYLDKLKERKFVFPVEISTYIISQACQGLYYAHTFRDKLTGQEANIIHRDISPHNIMLTYDGAVKIIDFGIAKSQTNSESTQAGTIKGKLSYLAPEYLEGLELDPRYDQFALGITLWEMLCSRKLFKENNDLAVLKKIQECKIPVPSSINPNVPKELDEIVLKALSKNRSKRFDNLDQMNRALMKFLYAKFPDFNATDLSYFAQELFRDEIKKDREKMFEFGKIDIKPFLEDMKKETERGSNATEAAAAGGSMVNSGDTPAIKKEAILDFGFDNDAKKKNTITVKKATVQSNKTNSSEDNTMSRRIADINDSTMINIKKETGTTSKVNKEGTKLLKVEKTTTKTKKKEKTSMGTYAAMLAFVLGGGFYFYQTFFAEQVAPPVAEVAPVVKPHDTNRNPAATDIAKTEQAAGEAKMTLTHFDKQKMQVFVDGKKLDVDIMNSVLVPVGKPFTLRVQIEGRKHFIKEVNLANNSSIEEEVPEMPAIAYGYVYTANDCSASGEVRFEIYGEKRVSPIPMKQEFGVAFPLGVDDKGVLAPAKYELFFKKTGEEIERKVEVTIKHEDQSVDLCEML